MFWLSDGNTLVQIGDVRFRLHRRNPPHYTGCIYADEETGATVYCLDSLEIGVKDFATLLNTIKSVLKRALYELV